MQGGYLMLDCTGIDLLKSSKQTINGIYKQCDDAFKSGKAVYAHNLIWGSGKGCSPIQVMLIPLEDNLYTATASTLQLVITSDNGVKVNNLVA